VIRAAPARQSEVTAAAEVVKQLLGIGLDRFDVPLVSTRWATGPGRLQLLICGSYPSVLVGVLWATLPARVARYRLKRAGIQASVPRPAHLSPRAGRGVMGALFGLEPTCLERALVQQSSLASQGILRDVVIGVPANGIGKDPAHA